MAKPLDALAFIEEIRVAEFWRKLLGEFEYSQRNPDDLFRWYTAMELRGPEEIRAYVNERMGRSIGGPVTGIVSEAPHPTREIIDIWLSSHDKARPASYVYGVVALVLASLVVMPKLNGCQNLKAPNPPARWLPQPATLSTGQNYGSPQALSTLPSSLPPAPAAAASASAATIAAQNGASRPRSAALGAETGPSTLLQSAASSSVSSSPSRIPASQSAASQGSPGSQGAPAGGSLAGASSGTGSRQKH